MTTASHLEATRRFYEAIARRYDRVYCAYGREARERLAWIARALGGSARVLVLGVGTGRELPALLDAGHRPVGLDASRAMLAVASRRARPVPLVEADLFARLPFPDASFEAALALHGTLAHAPDEGALAALSSELSRILVEGGRFVFEVPRPDWLEALHGAPGLPDADGRVTFREGKRFITEDRVADARIEGQAFTEDTWRGAFGGAFGLTIEVKDGGVWLIWGIRRMR